MAGVRVALLSEMGDWSASTRFRLLQHVTRLRRSLDSVDVFLADDRPARLPGRFGQLRYFGSHAVRYIRRYQEIAGLLDDYDAVLVQRGLYAVGPGLIARPLERFAGRVVLDLDDAVFAMKPSLVEKGRAARWLYGPQQTLRLLERADAVVVSTAELAAGLPTRCVEPVVLPTVPDPMGYAQAVHLDGPTTIGWAGTNGGLRFLDPLSEAFERLEADGATVEVVSSAPWPGRARYRRWRIEDERTLFARFSVGIMPLPDTPYTRSKAGFKLLQYMASGVPVVASPVGVNTRLVRESGAGLLADSPAEWESCLRRLIRDPGLRRQMAAEGRRFVERYADLGSQALILAALLSGDSLGELSASLPHSCEGGVPC